MWLVLGMALFRDRSIVEVVDKLDLALPGASEAPVAPSAVPQARARLGEEPMAWLFSHASRHWADASADRHRWRGLALYAVDGTSLRVPDTSENRAHFGSATGRTESGYPMARAVALMAVRSHLLAAARFGPYTRGEHSYANELWSEVPDSSLTLVDRGFLVAGVLIPSAKLPAAGRGAPRPRPWSQGCWGTPRRAWWTSSTATSATRTSSRRRPSCPAWRLQGGTYAATSSAFSIFTGRIFQFFPGVCSRPEPPSSMARLTTAALFPAMALWADRTPLRNDSVDFRARRCAASHLPG